MVRAIIEGVSQASQQNADDVRTFQYSAAPADKKRGAEFGSIGSFIANRHKRASGNNQDSLLWSRVTTFIHNTLYFIIISIGSHLIHCQNTIETCSICH